MKHFASTTRGMAIILLAINITLHFAGLTYPKEVVFDEVHFGKFVSQYCCKHENFFDIHPPHAKLLVAGALKLLSNYDGSFGFENIGDSYQGVPVLVLRLVPALAGSLIPLAFFAFLVGLGAPPAAGFLGGFILSFENSLLLQTRIVALDGLLILATLCAWWWFVLATRVNRSQLSAIGLALVAGAAAGLAVGSKITGLVALSVPFFIAGARSLSEKSWLTPWRYYLWFLAAALSVYLAGWGLHFSLLTEPGHGDLFYELTGEFWRDLVGYHQVMISKNVGLTSTHDYMSEWWSWPLMMRGVFYWSADLRYIYFLGNPVVWWGSALLLLSFAIAFAYGRFTGSKRYWVDLNSFGILVLMIAYLNSYLPYIFVSRALFLYHYQPPLVYGVGLVVIWLSSLGFFRGGGLFEQRRLYYLSMVVIAAGFVFMSPLTYGLGIEPWQDFIFAWFPGWR